MVSNPRAYGGGVPVCVCRRLPHDKDCPAAPFFEEGERIELDWEKQAAEESPPFIIVCPRCETRFPQTVHTVSYEYSQTHGITEQADLPIVCPFCGHSDKQTAPAIVGFDPDSDVDFSQFSIYCPAPSCGFVGDRTEGIVDIWLEKAVVKGTDSFIYLGHEYTRGEVYAEFTELSISCPDCGYSSGEDTD